MSNRRLKTYQVNFKVTVDTVLEFNAQNFEEALTKAREYKVKDLVKFDTDFNDGNVSVTGVYNCDGETNE